MTYRSPDQRRMFDQQATIFQYAGQTATWRQYLTASTGVIVAGFGTTVTYREQTITALFAPLPRAPETQTPAGMIAADEFQVTTRERIGRQDQFRWRGELYRIESDPSPSPLAGFWVSQAKRGASA